MISEEVGTQCWKRLVRILLSCLPRCAFSDLRSIRGKAYHGSVRHCVCLFVCFFLTLCGVFLWKVSFRTLFYLQFAKDNPHFWMRVEFVVNLANSENRVPNFPSMTVFWMKGILPHSSLRVVTL